MDMESSGSFLTFNQIVQLLQLAFYLRSMAFSGWACDLRYSSYDETITVLDKLHASDVQSTSYISES